MNDAAVWFAMIAATVLGWGYAFALALELKRLRDERSEILTDVLKLEHALKSAQKNDARDSKGRFTRA